MRPGYPLNPVNQDELIVALAGRAPNEGANNGAWPGLTIFRFTGPAGPMWGEVTSVLLCIVVEGRGTEETLRRYLGADYEIRSFGAIMSAFSGRAITTSDSITWQSVGLDSARRDKAVTT